MEAGLIRPSAEKMDQVRMKQVAYQYLCHLEEAKVWMEKVLHIKLPDIDCLEEHLRNGVILARLGHFVTPEVVPLGSIFDPDQKRYRAIGLSFRHTDNISLWLRALQRSGFPRIFLPEVPDVYDRKNMPKVIYCIHALSAHLFRNGRAPAIQDVYGKAQFSDDAIMIVCKELTDAGVAMPAFQKISGLFSESIDKNENSIHQAVVSVNEAIDHESTQNLLLAMTDPSLKLTHLMKENINHYLAALLVAKKDKCDTSLNKSLSESYEADNYDDLLTQAEIQGFIRSTNVTELWNKLCYAIEKKDVPLLRGTLVTYSFEIGETFVAENIEAYVSEITKLPVNENCCDRYREHILHIIGAGNVISDEQIRVSEILHKIINVLQGDDPAQLLKLLHEQCLGLSSMIQDFAVHLYFFELLEHLDMTGKLTLFDLKSCIAAMNYVAAVTTAVDSKNTHAIWSALNELNVLLQGIINLVEDADHDTKELYFHYLQNARISKLGKDDNVLNLEDIQQCIHDVNLSQDEWSKKLAAVQAVDSALMAKDCGALLDALEVINRENVQRCDVGLWMRCLSYLKLQKEAIYQDIWLSDIEDTTHVVKFLRKMGDCGKFDKSEMKCLLRAEKAIDYITKSECLFNALKEEFGTEQPSSWTVGSDKSPMAFLDIDSYEFLWAQPAGSFRIPHILSFETLEDFVKRFNDRKSAKKLEADAAIIIQKFFRGSRVRRELKSRVEAASVIQRWWRCKRNHILDANGERVLEYYLNHMKEIKSMRDCWIKRQERESSKVVSVQIVEETSSHHLQDATEELIQKLRCEVVEAIKRNQDLFRKVEEMDTKIGLLVRNKVSLAALIVPENKNRRATPVVETKGLKTLSKDSKTLLDGYQKLFYLLQTRSDYLSRLITTSPSNLTIQSCIFSLFNHGSSPRDAYLLLKLFATALKEEVETKFQTATDSVRGNPLVLRLAIGYARQTGGQHPLKYLLAPVILKVLEEQNVLDTNPVDIYRRWINETEARSGYQSEMPRTVYQEQALMQPEVLRRLIHNIELLKSWVTEFLHRLEKNTKRFPYALQFIAKTLHDALLQKFIHLAEKDVLKIVGHLIYYQYVNSALVAPDAFQIISLPADKPLRAEQRRNLASIAKILQYSASKTGFGEESQHLMQLNPFIIECHEVMKKICRECCSVENLEDHYHVSQYSEAMLIQRPRVYMTVAELCEAHHLLSEHRTTVAPDIADQIHEVLLDLGAAPSPVSLLGCSPEMASNLQIDKTLICLELDNQFSSEHVDKSSLERLRHDKTELELLRVCQKKELLELQRTLSRLQEKTRHFEDQLVCYEKYLETCLKNFHVSKKSRKSQQAIKYTGVQLMKKGIIASLDGVPVNQCKNLLFEISSTAVNGVFRVKCHYMGVQVDQADIDIQHLLLLQFEGCGVMNLFGKAEINVNLLLFLLNKKFNLKSGTLKSFKRAK